MAKPLLVIEPANELRFCGPFTKPVVTIMKLTNPTEHTILFKIKTTAPKKYCVRPNFGSVLPKSQTKVEICLQAFVYDPSEKNKHKFMVQSFVVPEGVTDYTKLWKDVEPDQLVDMKLRCVFELPSEGQEEENTVAPKEVVANEASPTPVGEEKLSEGMKEKLLQEVMQLKSEGTLLREENLHLKNQLMVAKYDSTHKKVEEAYAPALDKQVPMHYIALCILTALLGILLGKFLL